MREPFRTFLQELDDDPNSGKELLETEILRIMRKDGFSDVQVYEMSLEKLLNRFYDAYLWEASRILSKATVKSFLKKLKQLLSQAQCEVSASLSLRLATRRTTRANQTLRKKGYLEFFSRYNGIYSRILTIL